jgi:DNA-binding MarR family transcriptional regulator
MSLRREIAQRKPFRSAAEEAYLALQRTAGQLEQLHARQLKPWGVTPGQYNALRILRGAGASGLPCSTIGERLVTAVPDVTRLLDRLEARGWVRRGRDEEDRRVVRATITSAGTALLASLEAPVDAWLRTALGGLRAPEQRQLVRLLDALRATADAG